MVNLILHSGKHYPITVACRLAGIKYHSVLNRAKEKFKTHQEAFDDFVNGVAKQRAPKGSPRRPRPPRLRRQAVVTIRLLTPLDVPPHHVRQFVRQALAASAEKFEAHHAHQHIQVLDR